MFRYIWTKMPKVDILTQSEKLIDVKYRGVK